MDGLNWVNSTRMFINSKTLIMQQPHFRKGQFVDCVNIQKLNGNMVAPPLTLGAKYEIVRVIEDSKGYQHIDVGLISEYNYITSFETKEELEGGDLIHWCHPSRFVLSQYQNL